MRLVVSLLFLILVNGAVYVLSTGPTSDELERLELRQRELDGVLEVEEETAAKWSQLVELVETAQSALEPLPFDESSAQSDLRVAFLEAEKGLGIRRDALEFRPEKQTPSGFGGVRIRVIETGRFTHLVTYLHRLSNLKVPLALVDLSLVETARGAAPLLLTVTFSALHGQGNHKQTEAGRDLNELTFPEGLPEEALSRLMKWLQADGSSATQPSRDIFQKGAQPAVATTTVAPGISGLSEVEPVELERPRLTGFVFGGGRIDQPVAAIRFEERMWLVGVGEQVGPFRVKDMVVGEEATLVHEESGESLRLTIQ